MQTDASLAATSSAASHTAKPARVDLYVNIHKALRLFMTDTLMRLSCVDIDDAGQRQAVLSQVLDLLTACRMHVDKENTYVHPALEARCPGVSRAIGDEHVEHLRAITALERETQALQAAPHHAGALRLYRHLSRFVGENFEHMLVEETRHNAALWDAYTDEELMALHMRLVSSIPMAEMLVVMRWMVPALTPAEQDELIGGMPAPVRSGVLQTVAPHLGARAVERLSRLPALA